MKKNLALILALCLGLSLSAVAVGEVEGTTYVFETEYTFMEDVIGGGISGAAAALAPCLKCPKNSKSPSWLAAPMAWVPS